MPRSATGWRRTREITVAKQNETIDLRTLEEVQRLLATTDFASADDLAGRADPGELSQLADTLARRSPAAPATLAGGADPLPRRR